MKTAKLILAAAMAVTFATAPDIQSAPLREHRAIWMTPYLSSNWPTSAITEGNANTHKNILTKRMAKFRDQNVNVIYYHARSNCDATYNSAYEPWSAKVGGTRGTAPAFDPFGFLLDEAHKNGIEVYAWLNPYRYGTGKFGEGELNYENSHPDWLLTYNNASILNPGMEEVKQRIVDVVIDILDKYDVDGIIFDDYFYTSGTPMTADADLYNAYTSAGGKLSQADWRRANVNEMVARVHDAIKARKPHVVFGIGPAGVASPSTVESEYGLEPAPGGGDWQYNGIYSDPLAWYKAGSIDFMSPQIYWPSRYEALSEWWSKAAAKYNRHCYPSVDISDIATIKYAEFGHEIEHTRSVMPENASGYVFFEYSKFVNYYERVDGKSTEFGNILAQDVWNTKALVPLRTWVKSDEPQHVNNVVIDGTQLKWDGNDAGRYAIFRQPASQTTIAPELAGISYSASYDAGTDAADYNWYVATYDRYGKLSTLVSTNGAVTEGKAPELTFPANGSTPPDLFSFSWNHSSSLHRYIVEVAEDSEFNNLKGVLEVDGANSASVNGLPPLTVGKTYYWRVKAIDINCTHPVSATRSFTASRIAITAPANNAGDVSIQPTISWTAAAEGAEYTLSIAQTAEMNNPVMTTTIGTTSYTIPTHTLSTGHTYYAEVTATLNGKSTTSDVVAFSTINRNDYAAPQFVNPKADGTTLHVNECIEVAPWDGMNSINIQIAASTSFPTRTQYNGTLSNFETRSNELGNIKISSKNLVDGKTYYLRARGVYSLTTATALQYTDWTPVYSFTYSSEAGVDNITADNADTTRLDDDVTLIAGTDARHITVYNIAGAAIMNFDNAAGKKFDLSPLAAGVYIITDGKVTLKYVR